MLTKLRTIPEALDQAAACEGTGYTLVSDDGTETLRTYAELAESSRRIAHALAEFGVRSGDRVALILPSNDEFVSSFYGVARAGGVPVPLYPPMGVGQLGAYLDHARHITRTAKPRIVLTTARIKGVLGKLFSYVPELQRIITVSELDGDAALFRDPGVRIDQPCLVQFTSGSTSSPKGVVVSHENLSHNCHAIMHEGLRTRRGDRALSWLPLFHDMGLIGFVLAPMYHQVDASLMSPLRFLRRPATWLECISRHRGTITYGPNFAYALAAKRIRDHEIIGLDLSCLRVAGCGAEPIQASTLRAFAARFAPAGFTVDAFVPSYGMAENVLAIAFSMGLYSDVVSADRLAREGVAQPASDGETVEFVACGPAFPQHEIRVVHPEQRHPLPDRHVGEIQLRGPSVMQGYFEDPDATARAIVADGWLNTGDLGYLASGSIFVCGRAKDVIIVHGRNYHPQDLEWPATQVDGIRAGHCVAFSTRLPGLEREAVVVIAETHASEGFDELRLAVTTAIKNATGLTVDRVAIVPRDTIPKTSSGKLRRRQTRDLFETSSLSARTQESALRGVIRIAESQIAHLGQRMFSNRR